MCLAFALGFFVSISLPIYALCFLFCGCVPSKSHLLCEVVGSCEFDFLETDKMLSEISNMLQGMGANYRIQVS